MDTGKRINWTKLPAFFTGDSIDREIFNPVDDVYATHEELMHLRRDAEFYTDRKHWDDAELPRGLMASARAVLRHLDRMGIK